MTPAELLDLLTEDEVTCMREAFGLTKEQFDAIVKTRLSGGGQDLGLTSGCVAPVLRCIGRSSLFGRGESLRGRETVTGRPPGGPRRAP